MKQSKDRPNLYPSSGKPPLTQQEREIPKEQEAWCHQPDRRVCDCNRAGWTCPTRSGTSV